MENDLSKGAQCVRFSSSGEVLHKAIDKRTCISVYGGQRTQSHAYVARLKPRQRMASSSLRDHALFGCAAHASGQKGFLG